VPAMISKARVSFSFFALDVTQLGDQPLEPARRKGWPQLGRSVAWRATFKAATSDPGDFRLARPGAGPERESGEAFWAVYATGTATNNLSPTLAWGHFVPFRVDIPLRIDTPPWWPGRIGVQGRAFPHGVAVIVDAALDAPAGLSVADFRQITMRLRKDPLPGRWNGEPIDQGLNELAGRALVWLLRSLVGRRRVLLEGTRHPFTVVTVLRGATGGVATDMLEPELYCFASGRVRKPDDADRLVLDDQSTGDVFLAAERGRVLWAPSAFEVVDTNRHELSEFHRDLTWLSLQVDSLHRLILHVDAWDGDLPPVLLSRRRDAALLLGRLYGQADSTYGSPSVARQLDDCDIAPVNRVLQQIGRPPLSR